MRVNFPRSIELGIGLVDLARSKEVPENFFFGSDLISPIVVSLNELWVALLAERSYDRSTALANKLKPRLIKIDIVANLLAFELARILII